VSDLARLVVAELERDPTALDRLRELVGPPAQAPAPGTAAYTPRTLAVELGRTERSIRDAINRGELAAVKRGRGWIIGADAVASWTRARAANCQRVGSLSGRRRTSPGVAQRARERLQSS
jgi:hypothetical protein